jgi:polysaccharide export outer membrane protein
MKIYVLLLLCLPGVLKAQVVQGQESKLNFRAMAKESQISPPEEVRAFEAPLVKSYTLEAGDEITIEVWGHAELSGHHILGPDGRITLPVAGDLNIVGLTRDDAERAISAAFSKFYSDLAATIRIDRYTSFHIYVLGRVGNPGAIQFESQPTLLDAITRAGALPVNNNGGEKTTLTRCAVIRGRDKVVWVDLRNLLNHGDLSLNIRLARNDLVYIPDSGDQVVYVLGQVQHPGSIRMTPDMSFLDAFTQAGGVTEDAASQKIDIVRGSNGTNREFSLKELLANPKELNFSLNEGDIIYVPMRTLGKLGYVLQKTSPISGFAVIGSALK